jgi:hypothetical protein
MFDYDTTSDDILSRPRNTLALFVAKYEMELPLRLYNPRLLSVEKSVPYQKPSRPSLQPGHKFKSAPTQPPRRNDDTLNNSLGSLQLTNKQLPPLLPNPPQQTAIIDLEPVIPTVNNQANTKIEKTRISSMI